MGILEKHIQREFQIKYLRCYLASRTAANTYNAFEDVTRYVVASSLGSYSKSIDTDDFDIGFFEESNISVTFDNTQAFFNEGEGFFDGAIIDRSKIRLVAGYQDVQNPGSADFQTAFEGIIDDRGTAYDAMTDNVQFTILSLSSVINRLKADASTLVNGDTFAQVFYKLLNVTEITQLLTVDAGNINPKVNQAITDATWFRDKQLKEVITLLLLASNSVMTVSNNTIYVKPREESVSVRFRFYGKGAARPANIEKIQNLHSGLKRVITRVSVNNTISEGDYDSVIRRYGARLKTIDIGFIDNNAVETAVGEDIINEFAFPKQEMELTTSYLGNEVDLLDLVTVDQPGFVLDDEPALYGRAVYGQDSYVTRVGGVRISDIAGYKVLSITHDYQRFSTTLKLRAIGTKRYDYTV